MRKELDEQLCREFPNLYRQRNMSMRDTCLCWGFEVGDGWLNLLYDLSQKLEAEILKIPEEERECYSACQVKEKYARLAFYMTCSTDAMDKLIAAAEEQSVNTCETCGQPGELRSDTGWFYTSCEEHKRKDK